MKSGIVLLSVLLSMSGGLSSSQTASNATNSMTLEVGGPSDRQRYLHASSPCDFALGDAP